MRKKVLVTVLCLALLSAFGMSSVFADTVSTVKGKTISYNMTAEDEAAKFTAYQDPFSQTNPGIAAYGTQALRFFNWMSGGVWEFVVDDDYEKAVLNVTAWANVEIAYGIGESGASGEFTDVNTAVGGTFTTLKQQESVVVGNTFNFDLSGQTFGTGTSLYVFIRGYNAGNHNGDGAQVLSLSLALENNPIIDINDEYCYIVWETNPQGEALSAEGIDVSVDKCLIVFCTLDMNGVDSEFVSEYGIIVEFGGTTKCFAADRISVNGEYGVALYSVPKGQYTVSAFYKNSDGTIYKSTDSINFVQE